MCPKKKRICLVIFAVLSIASILVGRDLYYNGPYGMFGNRSATFDRWEGCETVRAYVQTQLAYKEKNGVFASELPPLLGVVSRENLAYLRLAIRCHEKQYWSEPHRFILVDQDHGKPVDYETQMPMLVAIPNWPNALLLQSSFEPVAHFRICRISASEPHDLQELTLSPDGWAMW